MATGKRQGEDDQKGEAGRRRKEGKNEGTAKKTTGRGGGVLPALQTARCTVWGKWSEVLAPPPTSIPPPVLLAPISASVSLSASHTLLRFPRGPDSTAGLIKQREAGDRKKEAEGKRGHTTGRHQLKPCSLT